MCTERQQEKERETETDKATDHEDIISVRHFTTSLEQLLHVIELHTDARTERYVHIQINRQRDRHKADNILIISIDCYE